MEQAIILSLKTAAAVQLAVAVINLKLATLLNWHDELARMPLLLREVFHVHGWFLSVTLSIFAVMTWRFTTEMTGQNAVGTWLAVAIGLFWAIRTVLQVTYYSSSHWRGQRMRTFVHIFCILGYGGLAAVYGAAAFALG